MSQVSQKLTFAPSPKAHALLRAQGLRKAFRMGESTVTVLKQVDLTIHAGEFVAIEGRSGSGKSTLMHILGALDAPDDGSVAYEGRDLASLPAAARARVRNVHFGFVFQFYHLLPELNVLENTLIGSLIQHSWTGFFRERKRIRERGAAVLTELGMGHRLDHRPNQLSGGQRQRVAIARALMNEPRVLFADEPTGNLDAETGQQIMEVLERLHRDNGQAIVMVTHDRALARTADRVLVMKDGKLEKAGE